jgi:large subunit ribosomal protein L15
MPFIYSISGKTYAPVNLDRIAHWIEQGRLTSSPEKPITARELVLSGCIHNAHDGVKLLSDVRHLSVSDFNCLLPRRLI